MFQNIRMQEMQKVQETLKKSRRKYTGAKWRRKGE